MTTTPAHAGTWGLRRAGTARLGSGGVPMPPQRRLVVAAAWCQTNLFSQATKNSFSFFTRTKKNMYITLYLLLELHTRCSFVGYGAFLGDIFIFALAVVLGIRIIIGFLPQRSDDILAKLGTGFLESLVDGV